MKTRLVYILPLLLFIALAVYFMFGLERAKEVGNDFVPSALIGKDFPQMDLPPLLADLPGLKTEDLKGQVQL